MESNNQLLKTIIEKQGIDILFECFAGLLAKSGQVGSSDFHVIPEESHRRSYKNDILLAPREDKFDPELYIENKEEGFLAIYTSRSSILDYLPEDFYTEVDNSQERSNEAGKERSKEEIKQYREQVKKEQESAKQFFRPLEVEFNKVRIEREIQEIVRLENFDQTLEIFWNQYAITDDRWRRFVRTLHLASYVVGDLEKTKSLIEYVLNTSVHIDLTVDECCQMTKEEQASLTGEKTVLGFNVNLGGTVYDFMEVCMLRIEDLSMSEFFDYFDEQSNDRKLLNAIINHYFPLHVEVRLDFTIDAKKKEEGEEGPDMVLGYSSTLG